MKQISTLQPEDKIRLFDQMFEHLSLLEQDKTVSPKMVGSLNKATGINGFKVAEIGTPVFDSGDRYFIMLESLDGKRNLEVTYYKDSLKPLINFI